MGWNPETAKLAGGTSNDTFRRMFAGEDAEAARRRDMERELISQRALWQLAEMQMPADVREAAERWKLGSVMTEMWRAAFIAGFRSGALAKTDAA